MRAISRDWATPLTLGVFLLMTGTGLLMFFHADRGVQKAVHEWLGWAMVAAAGLHVLANGAGLRRHLRLPGRGPAIVGVALLLLAASFVAGPGADTSAPPPVLALHAIGRAPLDQVAPLTGRPVEQLLGELAGAGIVVDGPGQSIERAVGGDRERLGHAMRLLFAPQARTGS